MPKISKVTLKADIRKITVTDRELLMQQRKNCHWNKRRKDRKIKGQRNRRENRKIKQRQIKGFIGEKRERNQELKNDNEYEIQEKKRGGK